MAFCKCGIAMDPKGRNFIVVKYLPSRSSFILFRISDILRIDNRSLLRF